MCNSSYRCAHSKRRASFLFYANDDFKSILQLQSHSFDSCFVFRLIKKGDYVENFLFFLWITLWIYSTFIHKSPKTGGMKGKKTEVCGKVSFFHRLFFKIVDNFFCIAQNMVISPKNDGLNRNSPSFLWINIIIFLILTRSRYL